MGSEKMGTLNMDPFSKKRFAVKGKRARVEGVLGGRGQWRGCFSNGKRNLNLKKLMGKMWLREKAKYAGEKVSEQDWVVRRWKGMQRPKGWS